MFSSIFGKRRSPVEDDTRPIPGPRTDEGFEIVDPASPRGGLLYPNVNGPANPYPQPQRPAPPLPATVRTNVDNSFNYMQGVPFQLSKELQMAANKGAFTTEIVDMLAFMTSKVNMSGYDYDFSTERSILKEI